MMRLSKHLWSCTTKLMQTSRCLLTKSHKCDILGREISPMINAWSLAWEALNGTMDETYPIREDVPEKLWG